MTSTYEGLQMIVGMALIDQHFLGTFMADRPRAIRDLPLSEEEAGIVLKMPGKSFADVSRRLDNYITSHTPPVRTLVPAGVHDWL